jgi:hypothetical protein
MLFFDAILGLHLWMRYADSMVHFFRSRMVWPLCCSGVSVRTARLMPPNAHAAVFVVQFLCRTL